MDATRATAADAGGGGGAPRDYKRDPKGTTTGGRFTTGGAGKTTTKAKPKPTPKPLTPVRPTGRHGPMRRGKANDPEQVRQLQALLGVLSLGKPPTNGDYDEATEQAVKAAQERLGLKVTGRATTGLVKRLIDAHSLSPCIKRSADADPYDLLRAALVAGDFDDEEADMPDDTELVEAPPSQEVLRYDRAFALDDILVRSGGDGRTVEAYAAVFDTPSEIKDQHGHYIEVISRSAFNRAISHGIERVNVFYHHGMTLHGTPSDLGAVPIGSPVDIRPDGRGLRTVTRFNKSQLADSVLEAIRDGNIRGYSFRGRIFQSNPVRVPRSRPGTALPTITRTELGLAEYGPTPTPAYAGAGIVAVRSIESVASVLASLDAQERAELVRMLTVPTPDDPGTGTATPVVGPGAEDSPEGRSGRFQQFQEELRKRGVLK